MFVTKLVRCHRIISRRNWAEARPLLLESIRRAEFVSVDFELTGLHEKNERYIGVDAAYDAHCQGVKAFMPIQLGICATRYDSDACEWVMTPSSIYLYPWANGEDGCFSVSTAALNFLVKNGFDCNEWILQGLGWLTPLQEQAKRQLIQSRLDEINSMKLAASVVKRLNVFSPMDIPEGPDKESMSSVKISITNWLRTETTTPLELPMESAFTRLLAHTYISHEFPSLFSHSVKREDTRYLCVYRDRADLFVEQINVLEDEMKKINEEIGVRELFDEISKLNKSIIGHNCFYDLLHTWHSFYGSIPSEIDSFKSKWMSKFPKTFDTKFIADDILGTQAPGTLKSLCDSHVDAGNVKMRIEPLAPQFQYYLPTSSSTDLSHDAGYDAMMTSIVFIHQIAHVMDRKHHDSTKPSESVLSSSCNRIRLVKTQPSSLYLAERKHHNISAHH